LPLGIVLLILAGSAISQPKSRYCMTVVDEHGATIPKATIKFSPISQPSSKVKQRYVTDSDGKIDVEVIDGNYDIEVKAENVSQNSFEKTDSFARSTTLYYDHIENENTATSNHLVSKYEHFNIRNNQA